MTLPYNSLKRYSAVKTSFLAPQKMKLGIVVAISLVISSMSEAAAQGAGPFSDFAGSWAGSGTLTLKTGTTERLRCQALYVVSPSGSGVRQNLRCESDSSGFELLSTVESNQGSLTGTWTETTRNVSGMLSGRVRAGSIESHVEGPGVNASFSMTARGTHQSVVIKSEGTEYTNVSMTLNLIKR
jgi:hypothetical protein